MTPTAYSILDLIIVPDDSTYKQSIENTIALAKAAESFGYTRMWFAEHHNMPGVASSAPQIIIGQVAQATHTLRIGSGGIMLPNHSPLIIAEQFGTLGTLFPGRIDLGLGRAPGTDQATARAIRSDFMQAAHSFPEEIDKIETYFSAENQTASVRAAIAEGVDVPIYILGSSPDSAHLAAKTGKPYAFASHFASTHLETALNIYRNEFQPSNTLESPYTIAGINVFIADTEEAAETMATSYLKMVISLLSGKVGNKLSKPEAMTDELKATMYHPSVQQMVKYSFIGTKEKVKREIRAFIERTQVDELIVSSNIYHTEERLKSYQYFSEIIQDLNNY